MNTFSARFQPGNHVIINGDIPGIVDRVIWTRGRTLPIYLIEYWHNGVVHTVEVHHDGCAAPKGNP